MLMLATMGWDTCTWEDDIPSAGLTVGTGSGNLPTIFPQKPDMRHRSKGRVGMARSVAWSCMVRQVALMTVWIDSTVEESPQYVA